MKRVLLAFLLSCLLAAPLALAEITTPGAGGVASAAVCLLTGGAGCTMVGAVVFSGVTRDVRASDDLITVADSTQTAAHDINLRMNVAAGGDVIDTDRARILMPDSTGFAAGTGVWFGSRGDDVTKAILRTSSNMGNLSGSGWKDGFAVFGGGLIQARNEQVVTCTDNGVGASPGAVTLDPQSSNVVLSNADPDGCNVTMDDATAAAISVSANSGGMKTGITIQLSGSGAGPVKFAAVANKLRNGFVLCSTTGLDLDDLMEMVYIDASDDFWGVTSCTQF